MGSARVLASLVLGLSLAATAALAPPAYKKKAGNHSLVIESNTDASIMRDGFLVGRPGNPIDTEPGVQEFLIQKNGWIPRLIRVQIPEESGTTTVEANLAKHEKDGVRIEIDYDQATSFESVKSVYDLESACPKDDNTSDIADAIACKRKTLLEDLSYLGLARILGGYRRLSSIEPGIDPFELVSALAPDAQTKTESHYWTAEKTFAANPRDRTAAGLLALASLLDNNCSRVMQVAQEFSAYEKTAPGVTLMRAICLEMKGSPKTAAKLYRHLAKTAPRFGSAYYMYARVSDSPTKSWKMLQQCVRKTPQYFPCFSQLAFLHERADRTKKVKQVLDTFRLRTRRRLRALFKNGFPSDDRLKSAYLQTPYSLEIVKALDAQNVDGVWRILATNTEHRLLSSPKIMVRIAKRFEKQEKFSEAGDIFAQLVKRKPKDHYFNGKLATLSRKSGDCERALEAAKVALATAYNQNERQSLFAVKAECFANTGRTRDALRAYETLANMKGYDWKMYFNMGLLEKRLGHKDAAISHFEKALAGDIPDAHVRAAENMLEKVKGSPRTAPASSQETVK